MQAVKNLQLIGSNDRPMLVGIALPDIGGAPVVVYAHGFNGFKDWGHFDLIAAQFAAAGFCFVKFNFSHNGTTVDAPESFTDPEAYGQNNYTKELDDLQTVIDWVLTVGNPYTTGANQQQMFLIGHSRGGGIVLLKAGEESRVKAVATWASVSECKTPWGNWEAARMQAWEKSGVDYYTNSRTGQRLPLYYQLHENYQSNRNRLDVVKALLKLTIPVLICHGTEDEAVPVKNAHRLQAVAHTADLFLVKTDHVFGRRHPWPHNYLPDAMQAVVDKTIRYFRKVSRP